jgi:phenylacetate-coenzyme A ligase PaaK-like adenylate-forming protein
MAPGPFAAVGPPVAASAAFEVMSATRASAREIAELQRSRLVRLLQAAQRAPLHRPALRGFDPHEVPLTALPVMDKVQLMQRFADSLTSDELSLEGLRAFCADPAQIGQPFCGRYWAWESSGSTGQPALFVQDAAAMAVYDALEAMRRHGPRPWAQFLDPLGLAERHAFVGAIGGHFASVVTVRRLCAAYPWLASTWRCFSILQPTRDLVAQLDDFAPTTLATYPTAALMLAGEARCGRLRARPQEIWTGGETLSPAMRACIASAFGAELRNSYGASEFLPIAWECAHRRLHVNADWVILEAVDAHRRPVPSGRLSHTTLLTNLANHLQPLIRFDIGDRIVLGGESCPCGSALPVVQVQGRCDDMLVVPGCDGSPVTLLPLALSTVLEDEAGLFDFQLRQTAARELRLLLGPGAPHTPAARARYRQALAGFAAAQGAVDLRISTQGVEALPLGRSGKLKRVVAAAARGPPAA